MGTMSDTHALQDRLLTVAKQEFAKQGLKGARLQKIADEKNAKLYQVDDNKYNKNTFDFCVGRTTENSSMLGQQTILSCLINRPFSCAPTKNPLASNT